MFLKLSLEKWFHGRFLILVLFSAEAAVHNIVFEIVDIFVRLDHLVGRTYWTKTSPWTYRSGPICDSVVSCCDQHTFKNQSVFVELLLLRSPQPLEFV